MSKTYEWLNPPEGNYSIEEYLDMLAYWEDSIGVSDNELSVKTEPLKKRFFGNKRVTVIVDRVILKRCDL